MAQIPQSKRPKPTPLLTSPPQKKPTNPYLKFFFIATKRLTQSFEGLNSSLAHNQLAIYGVAKWCEDGIYSKIHLAPKVLKMINLDTTSITY